MADEPELPPTWPEIVLKTGALALPGSLGRAAGSLAEDLIARRRSKAQEFASAVVDGVAPDDLRARLTNDRVSTVIGNAGDAAISSAVDAKRLALARVARNALDDDAALDESELVVLTLAQIEAPHIAALARLQEVQRANPVTREPEPAGVDEEQSDPPDVRQRRIAMWQASMLESEAVLGVLRGLGLITINQAMGAAGSFAAGGLTSLGETVLTYLNDPHGVHSD